MSREWTRSQKIDRTHWPSGPWDSEPDFHEWTTKAGYEAYAGRLDTGAWFGVVIGPCPTEGTMCLAFSHTLRDRRHRKYWYPDHKDPHLPGCASKTDVEGIVEWTMSMEHYDSPLPSKYHSWTRGAYKTLPEVIEICESMAQDIYDIDKEGTYVNYFKH